MRPLPLILLTAVASSALTAWIVQRPAAPAAPLVSETPAPKPAKTQTQHRTSPAPQPAQPAEQAPTQQTRASSTTPTAPLPAAVQTSPTLSSTAASALTPLATRAAVVEDEANRELARLVPLLNLDEAQQNRIFSTLVASSPYFVPGMIADASASLPKEANDVAAGTKTPLDAIQENLTPDQSNALMDEVLNNLDDYTEAADDDSWAPIIDKFIADLDAPLPETDFTDGGSNPVDASASLLDPTIEAIAAPPVIDGAVEETKFEE
jgi:hypothetical protein